jgi:CheY-like chemotaxis protein
MKLLVIEQQLRSTPLLREICRGGEDTVVFCRSGAEAVASLRRHRASFDWIVINGLSSGRSGPLVDMLRAHGCHAPIVYLAAGESDSCAGGSPVQRVSKIPGKTERARLTHFDLHRLLTQPGGAFEGEDILFDYHAPHARKRSRG